MLLMHLKSLFTQSENLFHQGIFAFHDNLSNEAIQAKIDLVIHNYVSMSKDDFTKKIPSKILTKTDQEWFHRL